MVSSTNLVLPIEATQSNGNQMTEAATGSWRRRSVAEILGLTIYNHKKDVHRQVEAVRSQLQNKRRRDRFLILPAGQLASVWDPLLFMLLVFISIVTPFDIAFGIGEEGKIGSLDVVNYSIDVFFVFDIFVNFNMAYYDSYGVLVTNHRRIAVNYMQGFFAIDLVSVIPFELFANKDKASGSSGSLFRMIKLLKLLKLLRVVRAFRIIRRWEAKMGFVNSTGMMLHLLVLVIIGAHWTSCLWRLVPTLLHADETVNSWMATYEVNGTPVVEKSAGSQYIASLYSAVGLLLSGGLPSDIAVTSEHEELAASIMGVFTAGLYVYLISAVTSTLSHADQSRQDFSAAIDHFNESAKLHNLESDLVVRARMYLKKARHVFRHKHSRQSIEALSPILQTEVAYHAHDYWIKNLGFVKIFTANNPGMERAAGPLCEMKSEAVRLRLAIASALEASCHSQFERLIAEGELCETMYIVQHGLVASRLSIRGKNKFIGEDIALTVAGFTWRRHYSAVALTFVDAHSLTATDLRDILKRDFPLMTQAVYSSARWLMLIRMLLKAGRLHRKKEFHRQRSTLIMNPEPESPKIQKSKSQRQLLSQLDKSSATVLNEMKGRVDKMEQSLTDRIESVEREVRVANEQIMTTLQNMPQQIASLR